MDSKENEQDSDRAAPRDWLDIVNQECDLEKGFRALESRDHFYTDTLRGRIRSLQLRPQEAERYFERACSRVSDFPYTSRNRLRAFYTKLYRFENLLISASEPPPRGALSPEGMLSDLLNGELPELDFSRDILMYDRGILLLQAGEAKKAARVFTSLLESRPCCFSDEQAAFYLGAASAHHELGNLDEARLHVENAGLCIPVLQSKINMGLCASSICALLEFWDQADQAQEWETFLKRLNFPENFSLVLCQRKQRIIARSRELNRVFLF